MGKKFYWVRGGDGTAGFRTPGKPGDNAVAGCKKCGLNKKCISPKMDVHGEGGKGIFILAEAPGANEDRKGEQLIGKAGAVLRRELRHLKVNLDKDCWKLNAVNCRPTDREGNNRKPTDIEISLCRGKVVESIRKHNPKVIVLAGSVAVKSFLGTRWKKNLGGIAKWRGWAIPDRDFGSWVVPVFHPSYVLRSGKNRVVSTVFRNDLKQIETCLRTPFPEWPDEDKAAQILWEKNQVEDYLTEVLKYNPKVLAFDYETTGLKPQAKGHKIACVAMCWQNNRTVSWEWRNTPMKLFRKVMGNPNIGKVAANLKMEDHWTAVAAKRVKIHGWLWDTMNAAHVLDNRKGITSLKFDVYKRYGIADYDSSISGYLQSGNEAGGNSFNRIFEAPREELLIYNAKDALFTYRLAVDQMTELGVLK